MMILATGTWNKSSRSGCPVAVRVRGFTLLELMVVLVIIGILLGSVVLSVGDGGREQELEQETRRLQGLLQLAGEQAVMNATELALVLDATAYSFAVLEGGSWQPVVDDDALRPRQLPPGLYLDVELEGQALNLSADRQQQQPQEDNPRQAMVLILSSGEFTPFRLSLRAEQTPVYTVLQGDLFGVLKWDTVREAL